MSNILHGTTITTLRKNRKRLVSVKVKSILEIVFENQLALFVFPGTLTPNDLLIKYKDGKLVGSQLRQPSHIHWAVDLLIKKDNNPELTNQLLTEMLKRWGEIIPLKNRDYESILSSMQVSKDQEFINKFKDLNKHGFFKIEFIINLMELLMIQEKTNKEDAYMFKDVVQGILGYKDLYAIISAATHKGG